LFGLRGRSPDPSRTLARRLSRRPASVPLPSLGRIGLWPGPRSFAKGGAEMCEKWL